MRFVAAGIALSLVAACTSMVALNGKPVGQPSSGAVASSPSSLSPTPSPSSPCTPANDHCLEPETWFAVEKYDGWPGDAFPALWQEAKLRWLWGYRCDCQVGMYGARTVVATADNVAVEAHVVMYYDDRTPALPPDEIKARKGDWLFGAVTSVDAGRRVLRVEGVTQDVPFDVARVVVEERTDVKERRPAE